MIADKRGFKEFGTLYGVGVGPGDPELLTLKAARVIAESSVVAVPVGQVGGESYALTIAAAHLRQEQTVLRLHFPMVKDLAIRNEKRQAAAQEILAELEAGRDVVFLTEGDPFFHSTFVYVLEHLPDCVPVETIPGVSSIMAAAVETKRPLVMADERLAVIPAAFGAIDDLRDLFANFETVILMKVFKVLDEVLDLLDELDLTEKAVLVERASHPEARVFRDVASLRKNRPHYLSLMIVHTERSA